MTWKIAALYRFTPIAAPEALCEELRVLFPQHGIIGTLLVAPEGINGTLASTGEGIAALVDILAERCGLQPDEVKYSFSETQPFGKLRVKFKREIITFKQPQADPNKVVGKYVSPAEWNALMNDPDVLVLDTRNTYETVFGTFKGAVVPEIEKFTEFADYVREAMQAEKKKKIAMFCTGGIRCEKASSFMLTEGFPEVYHLKGGILKYLEEIPQDQSKWQGECYVFDERVAVGHGLKPRN